MPQAISIEIFVDGEETHFLGEIKSGWINRWHKNYPNLCALTFQDPINVKNNLGFNRLPTEIQKAFRIRNPDVFFIAIVEGKKIVLGGIEITVHSPDGSNVEKRYPFIWSGRKYGFSAFIVCPYMKTRSGGQINKLPNRHSCRNIDFINDWEAHKSPQEPLQQIIPLKELQENYPSAHALLGRDLLSWDDLSGYFCDLLACKLGSVSAGDSLNNFSARMKDLAIACKAVTRFTKPTSFLEIHNKWIQIYNTRPDSGHWERGEGQFDSIDGRLMFTLDEASLNQSSHKLEFWMPQLSKKHAWIIEQSDRNYESKRLRNIIKVLNEYMVIKFADDLTANDLSILQENPGLTLERLDWKSDLYNVNTLLGTAKASTVARAGLKSPNQLILDEMSTLLSDVSVYLSTHRIYEKDWQNSFEAKIKALPANSKVLAPRIPKTQIQGSFDFGSNIVVFAEDCTKVQLMAIRQLHRHCFD